MKNKQLSQAIHNFIVSPTQMAIDKKMIMFDIWGTVAHVIMLSKTHIISQTIAAKLLQALMEISHESKKGNFEIDPSQGSQLTLEAKIIEKAGEKAGLSAHTARSRNDQIMVTEMMYLREELLKLMRKAVKVMEAVVELGSNHILTVMPGYTHMQPAKPTTFGQWCLAYCEGMLRGIESLKHIFEQYSLNPLGAAESYGTSWPIDRELTTKLLGFAATWRVPQDVISSRGHFQVEILARLNMLTLTMNKMATDLMLFTSFEYGMVSLGEDVAKRLHPVTGSSIMAQKKNPDAVELIRGTAPQLAGIYQAALGILTGLPMGYNRDSREIKEYIGMGLSKTNSCLEALEQVVNTMRPNKVRMLELVKQNYSLTTDLADCLAQVSGIPYRLMYKIVGKVVDKAIAKGQPLAQVSLEEINQTATEFNVKLKVTQKQINEILDPIKTVQKRKHLGGANREIMEKLVFAQKKQVKILQQWISDSLNQITKAQKKTRDYALKIIGKTRL